MSLANGRTYLAIPGPSVMPDRVLRAMHRASPNIYAGELVEMMPPLVADLKAVARTKGHCAIYIANGHGVWEAALANILGPGDRALVLATGRFAHGWADMARRMGVEVDIVEFGRSSPVDPDQVGPAVTARDDYKAVLMVQTDTSSTAKSDVAAVRRALDAVGYEGLFCVDCIASLGCDPYEMDAWGVDVTVAASQKGLMTPPGVGFVWFNDRADAVREAMPRLSAYWDWRPRAFAKALYQYFGGTAATHHVYGLREALDMIAEEGLENVWARHETLARAVWAAFDAWSTEGPLRMNIDDPAARGFSVTGARMTPPLATDLRMWLEQNAGVTLGIGLGMAEPDDPAWHGFFRVGHMGHLNAHMVLGVLATMESGLRALGIPHGPGALDAAAVICAGSS